MNTDDRDAGSALDALGSTLTETIIETYRGAAETSYGAWRRAMEKSGSQREGLLAVMEGVLSTARIFSAAELCALEADPEYPMIVKMISIPGKDIGVPNADCTYQQAVLHGDHTYRIFGNRGTARLFDIEVFSGHSAEMKNFKLVTSLDAEGHNIPTGSDMEIVLSREPQAGMWLPLPDGLTTLFFRQIYYDWENEEPAMMVIEREGAEYPPPPLTQDRFEQRVQAMCGYMRDVTNAMYGPVGAETALSADGTAIPNPEAPMGFSGFTPARGYYNCKPGEALILEFTPPETEYWGFHLWNLQGDGLHAHLRQSSINGHQAAVDADGQVRIVISREDPGVKNWLDSHDREFGLVFGRFYKVDAAPDMPLKRVAMTALREHLPEGAVFVTPEERRESIRRRFISMHRRLQTDY